MIIFTFKKLNITFHFTFFAALALILILRNNAVVYMGIAACLIHEIGHLTAMFICREKVKEIVFYGAGIRIQTKKKYGLSFHNEIFIIISGIFANLLCTICLLNINNGYATLFSQVNLIIALFNCLPFTLFDGGKLRDLIISRYIPLSKYDKYLNNFKIYDFFLFLVFVLILFISGNRNPGVYLSLLFFAFHGNYMVT
jgi:Zn-dependent protease